MDQRAYLLALVSLDLDEDEALVISTLTLPEGSRTDQPTRETRCIEGPCQRGEGTVDFGLLLSKIRGEREWPRTPSQRACLASLESATRWHKNQIRAHILGKARKIGLSTCANTLTKAVSVSFDFEGKVEGYGTVFASHELSYIGEDRSRGRLRGEARTFLEDGTLISTPHMGTFTRDGSKVCSYFTDATNQGVVNFVVWDIDILAKTAAVKYWEVRSGG